MAKKFKVRIAGLGQNDPEKSMQPYRVRFSVYKDDIRFFDGILKCTKANIDADEIEEMVRAQAVAMIEARPLAAKIIDKIRVEVDV